MDPYLKYQWYLNNKLNLNVYSIWMQGINGSNIKVGIIDDGIDEDHEDLRVNIEKEKNSEVKLGAHGTAIAGIIGASGRNFKGIRGIASETRIYNYNFLRNFNIQRLINNKEKILELDVINNSWGGADYTGNFIYPDKGYYEFWDFILVNGRNKKGSVLVFPSGNGGKINIDLSNYDGYLNHRGIIVIGAISEFGIKASYSESGSNLWAVAFSGDVNSRGITTTDITGNLGGNNNFTESIHEITNRDYTTSFTGTSASAAMVSGCIALMLEVNPNLMWRDVKQIIAKSTKRIDESDTSWKVNSRGVYYSDKYGFGLIDIAKAVEMSKHWNGLSTERTYSSNQFNIDAIKEFDIESSILIKNDIIKNIEYVNVEMDLKNLNIPDLNIRLISPSNQEATLMIPHRCSAPQCGGVQLFQFGVSNFLDEEIAGSWKLIVKSKTKLSIPQLYWNIKFYGR